MSRNISYIAAASLFVVLAIGTIILKNRKADSTPTAQNPPSATHRTRPPITSLDPSSSANGSGVKNPGSSGVASPGEATADVERILETMREAAITYDPAGLSKIEPYLLHSDAGVRKAAINSMIKLGHASAGPMMRKAAASAYTPYEAVNLLEAADYVELPSAVFKRKDPSEVKKGPKPKMQRGRPPSLDAPNQGPQPAAPAEPEE
jgi:hypothetical protein